MIGPKSIKNENMSLTKMRMYMYDWSKKYMYDWSVYV